MNTKTKAVAGTGAAVAALAAVMAVTPKTTQIKGSYDIDIVSPYRAEIQVEVPENFTPDIITLKMNDMEVCKTLLPDGELITYPTVVSDTDRLSVDMCVRGKLAGTAVFNEDGTLSITVDNEYIIDEAVTEDEE